MPHPRAVIAALSLVLASGMPLGTVHADERNPTRAERQAAQNKVTLAKRKVANLQAKAEYAIEVHNGLLVELRNAVAAHGRAENRAEAARAALTAAQQAAERAVLDAEVAQTAALDADRAKDLSALEAVGAQKTLDRFAFGAYRGAGTFGMVAQLLTADDPLELANGHNLINTVADVQHRAIVELNVAKTHAATASSQADAAQAAATVAADQATAALATRESARAAAEQANQSAALQAQTARRASDAAHQAKARAAALVAQAQAQLHRATLTASSLERAARAARRAAANVRTGTPPSEAASVAIRWAFTQIGVPYSWGGGDENGPTYGFAQGAGTKGFDCSGLTLYAYAHAGIRLDHYSGSQWNQGKRISSRADVLPGDLMYFGYDPSDPSTIHHVALYIGNNQMIEAPYTGSVVRVGSSERDDFVGATRPWA